MMLKIYVFAISLTIVLGYIGDDKFIKKYAMMKVYESCFGQDVVKEVRKEMKAAAAKCAGISPSAPGAVIMPVKVQTPTHNQVSIRQKPQTQVTSASAQHSAGIAHVAEPVTHMPPLQVNDQSKTHGLDLNKLQQAILAGYNKHLQQQQQQQSFIPPQQPFVPQQYRPSYYQPQPQPAFNNLFYPQQNMYHQPQYIPNPYFQQQPLFPYHGPAYPGQRSSRDLDVRGQLETLATRMTGKIRNVTCIMQELGYLDQNLEPDYERMIERIGRLPVQDDLKKDMTDGVNFCKKFSQCLPDDSKDKIVSEMVRPMFFFRCYKHKKLEACIMKDVRDRYTPTDEMNEDNIPGSENRAGKEFPEDNMNTALYEFIYGDDSADVSNIM